MPKTAFYFIRSAMTWFTTSVFLSQNRVSPKEAFEGLELCERKLSCTVLRGLDGSNPVRLLGNTPRIVASSPTCCAGYNYAHTWPSPLERNSGRMEIQSLLGAGGME